MKMLILLISIISLSLCAADEDCLEYDAVPPKCVDWVQPEHGIPIFFPHQFNCSRYWVCEPDLTDCLFECPPMAGGGNLYFDFNIDYEHGGPVCNWPFEVDCTNKPSVCGECQAWQECVECTDCPDCTGCEDGWMCIPDCKLDVHCNGDEYCDFEDGGEGNCQKGCRNDEPCSVNLDVACGVCSNHVCDEPECCTDEDCDGVCENGVCTGCSTDDDCTAMVCSTCEDHQCNDPECCTDDDCLDSQFCNDSHQCQDGCNTNSDCNSVMSCAVCQMDNTCTNPECCVDSDCPNDKPICNEDNVCMAGCRADSECSNYDGICNGDYTPDGATCFYCENDSSASIGSCLPGCASDANCAGDYTCNGAHVCIGAVGSNVLQTISLTTQMCNGCSGQNVEGGPVFYLTGEDSTEGTPTCNTIGLDHPDEIDFSPNNLVKFENEEDKDLLAECYLNNLQGQVKKATVIWTGAGELTVKNKQIDFTMTDSDTCVSSCCVPGPLVSDESYELSCQKNCQNTLICN